MNDTLLKLLGLLLTSYWWLPLLRVVTDEAWRVADPDDLPAADEFPLSGAAERGSQGWEGANSAARGQLNEAWFVGRRPVIRRAQRFHNNSRSTPALSSFGRQSA